MFRRALFGLFLFACPVSAQVVELPASVSGDLGVPIPLVAKGDLGDNVIWMAPDKGITIIDGTFLGGASSKALVFGSTPGVFRAWALTAKGNKLSPIAECRVTIGTPNPAPPIPPKPPDPPTPPLPPTPIPEKGFRVLMIYDEKTKATLPPGQFNAMFGDQVQSYLAQQCAKGTDGQTPEYRIWPVGIDPTPDQSSPLKAAFARPRQSVPWLIISNGASGYEGPLPRTVDETLALIRKFGN